MFTPKLLIVCSKRFCTAPKFARASDTVLIAVEIAAIAAEAPAALDTDSVLIPNEDRPTLARFTEITSVLLTPVWKDTAEAVFNRLIPLNLVPDAMFAISDLS